MPRLTIPEALVRITDGSDRTYTVRGETVFECLKNFCEDNPQFSSHLFYENGHVKGHYILVVGEEAVRPDVPVREDGEVEVLLATSGG